MLEWFLSVHALFRAMRSKAADAVDHLEAGNQKAAATINGYLTEDYQALYRLWEEQGFDTAEMGSLARHIHFGERHDYDDILQTDIPFIERKAEQHIREGARLPNAVGFEDLLHPTIQASSLAQYRAGHFRDAVFNAIVAIFDLIRSRTKVKGDGVNLIGQVFGLDNARLIFTELDTESGRDDQKGFLQILMGAYVGIRNPKAHSLEHDLDGPKAAQYLVFASLLARRVADAKLTKARKVAVSPKSAPATKSVAAAPKPAAAPSNGPPRKVR